MKRKQMRCKNCLRSCSVCSSGMCLYCHHATADERRRQYARVVNRALNQWARQFMQYTTMEGK